MPHYTYHARDARGKKHTGRIQASTPGELLAHVTGRGLFLITYREAEARDRSRPMNGKELSAFCRELGTMLQAGITLLRAFEIMLRRDLPRAQRQAYEGVYRLLLIGTAMSDAMARQGRVFPILLTSMFRAGEANGMVDVTALRMAEHYEKEYRLAGKIKSATTYPMVLLILTVIIIIAVFTFVLPRFMGLYGDRPLPAITRAVVAVSALFTRHYLFLLLGLAALLAVLALVLRVPGVRVGLDRFKLHMPVLGRLLRIIATARFARTLSSLYASGLSMLTALGIARGTVGNAYIAAQFEGLVQDVRSGVSLAQALERVDGFDKKLCATVAVGEESGRLEAMLLAVADSFDYESAEAAARLVTILEPVCIIAMAVIIGTVMIAVLLPILGMYDALDSTATLFHLGARL